MPFPWRTVATTLLAILFPVHMAQAQNHLPFSVPAAQALSKALPHAVALRGCTQEDAPALELYFTPSPWSGVGDPQPPFLRFEISASPTEDLSNTTLELLPLRRDPARPGRIARAEFSTDVRRSTWLTGTLTLDHAAPGKPITGHYSLTTPSGQLLTSAFQTPYPTKPSVCG